MIEVKLPANNGKIETISNKDKKSIVLVGANGSGKTRMSAWVEFNNETINIHRISAQKSLDMPEATVTSEIDKIQENFLYGNNDSNKTWMRSQGKKSYRWGDKPVTHLLDDFSQLMTLLMTESYEKSIEYRNEHKKGNSSFNNETKLERIKKIWEDVIPNKKLKICPGKIEVSIRDDTVSLYNRAGMSDGERAIFYFIGEVLCALDNSLIIIDEPENHLHKSILVRLWNAVEAERPDCMFMYITHNLNFATSRVNSQLIWVKNMPAFESWEYELLDSDNDKLDALQLEIMGNRQKVLLIEGGEKSSLDKKIYARLFRDYNVIPVDNCNKVIDFTKAYNDLADLNYVEVKGIIDRDRRSDDEINKLKENNIFCLEVAEIENLFLLPEVVKVAAEKFCLPRDYEQIMNDVKENVFEFLQKDIDSQSLLFAKQEVNNRIYQVINRKTDDVDDFKNNFSSLSSEINVVEMYNDVKREIQTIINEKNYYKALKIINNKGLINASKLPNKFGWKKSNYIDYILNLLDKSSEMIGAMKKYIKIDKE